MQKKNKNKRQFTAYIERYVKFQRFRSIKKHSSADVVENNMRYLFLLFGLIFFFSCSSQPVLIDSSEDSLEMIGGKKALLESIVYPANALNRGIEGEVRLLAYIDTAGAVRKCKVVKGNEYLNDAAVRALKKQRFRPYSINGEKRPVQVVIPIIFTISPDLDIRKYERAYVMDKAEAYLGNPPDPITNYRCGRSPGDKHSYYSEGLFWWPQEGDTLAPYTYADEEPNPDSFREHADVLAKLGKIVPALTAAYSISGEEKYAEAAADHLRAWFIDNDTRMKPHLQYAGAIPNRTSGRDTGIYEGLHFAEVIRSLPLLENFLREDEIIKLRDWFREYTGFLLDHENGISVRDRLDVYGNAWLLQLGTAADYLDNPEIKEIARTYYREVLFPRLAGLSSPLYREDLNRIFRNDIFLNADLLAMNAHVLGKRKNELWNLKLSGGHGLRSLMHYYYRRAMEQETVNPEHYRGRFLSLLLAGEAYEKNEYLELWKIREDRYEDKTDFPLRQPVLWME